MILVGHKFNAIRCRLIKPIITSDERGPWEILWNKFVDTFGEDRYQYYVWGKNCNQRIQLYSLKFIIFINLAVFLLSVTFYIIGSLIVSTTFYWSSAGLYALMDFTQMPKFLMKYKIQADKNVPVDPKRFLKVNTVTSKMMFCFNY